MSDLFGNHIVGFPTRRLKYVLEWAGCVPVDRLVICYISYVRGAKSSIVIKLTLLEVICQCICLHCDLFAGEMDHIGARA